MREELPKYFEYVQRHPRTLVGEQVPSMTGDGMEVLRDSADAKDWQDAVKEQLALEVRDRAQRRLEDDRGALDMIHWSIELFQNNPDLVPGTRQFDRQLAADFVRVAKPYEVRTDGKLQGYSIPVQGLVDQLRRQVTAARTESAKSAQAQAAAKAAGTGQAGPGRPRTANPAPRPATTDETPQAGIPGKAGSSSEAENFDTLFGTLGMPHAPRF